MHQRAAVLWCFGFLDAQSPNPSRNSPARTHKNPIRKHRKAEKSHTQQKEGRKRRTITFIGFRVSNYYLK